MTSEQAVRSDDLRPPPVVQDLEREFPGVVVWYGMSTGTWWALVRCRQAARLVEALSPAELRGAIRNAWGWPWPR